MKRFFLIAVLFAPTIAIASGGGSSLTPSAKIASPTDSTTGQIKVKWASGGNDTDSAFPRVGGVVRITSGDWTAHPFASFQAAINALPKLQRHYVTVIGGAGTFPGGVVAGFLTDHTDQSGYFTIVGTPVTPTLASGVTSGTATSGTAASNSRSTLTLTGAGWTASDLRGHFLNVTAGSGYGGTTGPTGLGSVYLIEDNTATVITVQNGATFSSTTVFSIIDPGTFMQKNTALNSTNQGAALLFQDDISPANVNFLNIGGGGASIGLFFLNTTTATPTNLRFDTSATTTGLFAQGVTTKIQTSGLYFKTISSPVNMQRVNTALLQGAVLDGCGPVSLSESTHVRWRIADHRTGTGIGVSATRIFSFGVDATSIVGAGTGVSMTGIGYASSGFLFAGGTQTGGFGMLVADTGYFHVQSPNTAYPSGTSITGPSGDLSLDGQTVTWASVLSNVRTRVNNVTVQAN